MTLSSKSKASISKTKCFIGFALIRSGAIMKKNFKDWKALSTSTPYKKG